MQVFAHPLLMICAQEASCTDVAVRSFARKVTKVLTNYGKSKQVQMQLHYHELITMHQQTVLTHYTCLDGNFLPRVLDEWLRINRGLVLATTHVVSVIMSAFKAALDGKRRAILVQGGAHVTALVLVDGSWCHLDSEAESPVALTNVQIQSLLDKGARHITTE